MLTGFERVLRAMRVELVLGGLLFSMLLTGLLSVIGSLDPRAFRFEHSLADLRTALLSEQQPDQNARIAVVLIDEETLRDEPYSSPVDRGLLARLVTKLDALGAKAIALDIVFYKPTEPAKDRALQNALRAARARVIMAAGDKRSRIDDAERAYQKGFLDGVGRTAGYVNLDRDRDEVTRWKLSPAAGSEYAQSFAELVAAADGARDPDPGGRIAWLKRPRNGADAFFSIKAETLIGKGQPITALEQQLKGRLVLVGGRFEDRDLHRVPLFASDNESNSRQIHGVFLHAHKIAQILDNRSVREVPMVPVVMLVGVFGFCLGWTFSRQGFSWLVGGLATGCIIAADMLVFWGLRRVLPYTPLTIAWFGSAFAGFVLAKAVGFFKNEQDELT